MSLKKNVIANYLGQGWTALMGLAFVPLYIKYLGAEAYGLIGISAMLQAFLALLNLGMTPALSREMARFTGGTLPIEDIRDLLRSIELLAIVLGLCFAAVVWGLSDWVASEWVNAEELSLASVSRAFSLMGIVVACFLVQNMYHSSLVGLQRQVALNVCTAIMTTLRTAGAVGILIFVSATIEAFFIWQALMALTTSLAYAILVYRSLPRPPRRARFSLPALKSIWRFSGAMAGNSAAAIVLNNIDRVILSKQLSLEMFGFYSLAKMIAANVLALAYPITTAAYPKFIELIEQKKQQALAAVFHGTAQFLSVIVMAAAVVLVLYAEQVLLLWTQDEALVAQTYRLVQLLTAGSVLYSLIYLPIYLDFAHGEVKTFVTYQVLSIPVLIVIIGILAHYYGAVGAACVWLVRGLITLAILPHLLRSPLLDTDKWQWYTRDIGLPLAASAAVVLAIKFTIPIPQSMVLAILYLGIVGLLSLAAAIFAANFIRQRLTTRLRRK